VHDSGRRAPDRRAARVVLPASAAALKPGTAYAWRVRTWSSGDANAEACASGWSFGRFTTSLFGGFDAQVIPHHETFRTTIQSPYSSAKG
jgi:hypothetical protein